MEQHSYEADISALNCTLQIRLNDVEIFSAPISGQMRTDIPLNLGILESGEQEIEVRDIPLPNELQLHENSYIRHQINEFDLSTGKYQFLQQFDEYQTSPVQKGNPFIFHKSTFKAEVPYKIDAWQNGQNLRDIKGIKSDLIKAYNKLIRHISNKKFDLVIEALTRREKNTATSLYLSEEESRNRISKLLYDFENDFKVLPLSDATKIEYSAYGKLVCLKLEDNMPALRLENLETNEDLILPLNFYLPEGKTEFEVI